MTGVRVALEELQKQDLPSLPELWHNPEVMRYADEFPSLRHWSKASGVERAWKAYREWRADLGPRYAQLIHRLPDGARIGESFVAPLPEGFRFGHWRKPHGVPTVMGDIKLDPPYWGEGLGTEGMRQVVRFVFGRADCELFVVPPHVHGNPAAVRVYEKAGFLPRFKVRNVGHRIMELWKARYQELY